MIWKAMAASDYCAEFLCIMIGLPFVYGFANTRWLQGIDMILEKKKEVRKIHLLRIIGLMEADFNTALIFSFVNQMMTIAEENSLSDKQRGLRKDRTSTDTVMTKLLTFECAGEKKKSTIREVIHDCKACFDQVDRSQSNI